MSQEKNQSHTTEVDRVTALAYKMAVRHVGKASVLELANEGETYTNARGNSQTVRNGRVLVELSYPEKDKDRFYYHAHHALDRARRQLYTPEEFKDYEDSQQLRSAAAAHRETSKRLRGNGWLITHR